MWAEVIREISRPAQKIPHAVLHALVFSWSLAGCEGLWDLKRSGLSMLIASLQISESYQGTSKWKELGSLNRCTEGSPLGTWLELTWVRNKFLLYYTTEISVCLLQQLAFPLTMQNVILILFLYLHNFNFLSSLSILYIIAMCLEDKG